LPPFYLLVFQLFSGLLVTMVVFWQVPVKGSRLALFCLFVPGNVVADGEVSVWLARLVFRGHDVAVSLA
jgi:hypothetical protein